MSRKSKIDPGKKLEAVERILSGESSASEEAHHLGIHSTSIDNWKMQYLSMGPAALMVQKNNKLYPVELKYSAVHDYI